MFKKFVATLLTCIFVLTSARFAYAETSASNFNFNFNFTIIDEIVAEDIWFEVSELFGRVYYFRDTAYYTISMDLHPEEGVLRVFYRDKQTSLATFEAVDLFSAATFLNTSVSRGNLDVDTVILVMEEARHLVTNGFVQLGGVMDTSRYVTIYELGDTHSYATPLGPVTNPVIRQLLNGRGHFERGWSHAPGQVITQNGWTARLYTSVEFFQGASTLLFRIAALVSIATVSWIVSKPVTAVALIFYFTTNGHDLVTAFAQDAYTYRIQVRSWREGRIVGWGGGWASDLRVYHLDVTRGRVAGAMVDAHRATTTWQFTMTVLLEEAIRRFRWFTGL